VYADVHRTAIRVLTRLLADIRDLPEQGLGLLLDSSLMVKQSLRKVPMLIAASLSPPAV
jgi:hypothetical protein